MDKLPTRSGVSETGTSPSKGLACPKSNSIYNNGYQPAYYVLNTIGRMTLLKDLTLPMEKSGIYRIT